MTIEQFGQQIKTKYPEYQDLPDKEIGEKMITKYPQYQDMIDKIPIESEKTDTFLAGHPVLKGISDFVGTTGLGKGIAQGIFLKFTQEGKNVMKQFEEGKITQEEIEKIIGKTATTKEILGSAGQMATNIVIAGAKVPATILGKAAQFGGLSALGTGAKTLEKGGDIKEIAKNAFYGGLTGAAIGGTIGIIGKGLKTFTQKTPEAVYNNTLRVQQKIKLAGKSPAGFLVEKGTWGNLGTFKKTTDEGIKKANEEISKTLTNNIKTISGKDIYREASEVLSKKFGKIVDPTEISGALRRVQAAGLKTNEAIPLVEANQIRQQLDKLLGDRYFLSQTESPILKEAMGTISNVLRRNIQSLSGTQSQFSQLSKWIKTQQIVDRAIGIADSKYGLGLLDVLAGAGGATLGFTGTEGDIGERLKNALIGGVAGIVLEKTARSAGLQTGVAQIINKLGQIPTDTAGKVNKIVVINLIKQLLSQTTENTDTQTK